ncbi:MAG TPA: PfkB family carbohydrate kinase, partial [Candidatus Micrarchaeota archaeon]|nr:PfkB family carbohydrate kinase [Candidatus Micrarchaeota archaeon]
KKLVDTTGAGDNFAAGVLWGLAHGKDAAASAKIGAKLGAAAVTKFGASLPIDFRLE